MGFNVSDLPTDFYVWDTETDQPVVDRPHGMTREAALTAAPKHFATVFDLFDFCRNPSGTTGDEWMTPHALGCGTTWLEAVYAYDSADELLDELQREWFLKIVDFDTVEGLRVTRTVRCRVQRLNSVLDRFCTRYSGRNAATVNVLAALQKTIEAVEVSSAAEADKRKAGAA